MIVSQSEATVCFGQCGVKDGEVDAHESTHDAASHTHTHTSDRSDADVLVYPDVARAHAGVTNTPNTRVGRRSGRRK